MVDADRRLFHAADYVVFVALLVVSLAIGVYHAFSGGKQKTTSEYLMANRQMRLLPVAISMTVSVISANTLLGVPTETYTQGPQYSMMSLALIPCTLAIVFGIVPIIFPLKMTSVHEYLQLRYNSRVVRLLGTLLFFITQSFYVGTVIYGPSTALEAVTGIPTWASILIVSVIGTLYTVMGGIKAVIWTDVFQSSIMLAGMITLTAMGSAAVGGFSRIVDLCGRDGRLDFFVWKFSFHDRYTFYTVILGFFFYFFAMNGINQPTAQRYCAMPTLRRAQFASVVAAVGMVIFTLVSMLAGLTMYGYYAHKRCDPYRAGYVSNPNQILPYYVLEVIPYPGLPGLFTSCLFSAALSTISSSVNSLAAVVWEDIFKHRFPHWAEEKQTRFVKGISLFFGAVCMIFAYLVSAIGDTILIIAIASVGLALGPLLGLFCLGTMFPHANSKGAITGAVIAFCFIAWCLVGSLTIPSVKAVLPTHIDGCINPNATLSNFTETTTGMYKYHPTTVASTTQAANTTEPEYEHPLNNLYKISYAWYPAIGGIFTVVIGLVVSLITKRRAELDKVPPNTVSGCVRGLVRNNKLYTVVQADDNPVGNSPKLKTLKDMS